MRLELAHASRLALAGELTASIAHELKQPLAAVVANANAGKILLRHLAHESQSGELGQVLADIVDDSQRAVEIMHRLRALMRKQPLNRQPMDLNQLVADTLPLLRGELQRRGVTELTRLSSSLPAVEADKICLQQVLLNLLVNALDAMDVGTGAPRQLVVETRSNDAGAQVIVADSGPGIPEGCSEKVFEPFFSTKKQGIGLGLAVARSIVEAHSGRIWAEDGAAGGARFHVWLPAPGVA